MIIESIRVQNFRCIQDAILPCEQLTVLIGPNSSGKSSFLKALDLFYDPSAKYTEDDFYDRTISQDIIITIMFTDLTDDESELFKKYVESGKLTVEKVINWELSKVSQKYYGTSLQNPDFDTYRSASGPQLRTEYNKLRENGYSNLPEYTNKQNAEISLQAWEESNPDQCSRQRDDGQFFGFKEVGKARLERYTRFILIPAVRDASEDASEGRGRSLTEIMDLVVRSVLENQKEIKALKESTQKDYDKIVDPDKIEELQNLEQNLSSTLKTYVPDAGVKLTWLTEDLVTIPMPRADVKLVEDEYLSSVERTGHGLQRAFIMTMLQHLAVAQSSKDKEDEFSIILPNLIIGIEEPELYQHPNRQRHLSNILLRLAFGHINGVADRTQIIYTTHSPLFVDIKRFNKIRAIRKIQEVPDTPKQTKVIYTNLDEVARIIEKADGKPDGTYTESTLKPRLLTLMTPWMNEGFFSDVVVLVEGEEDRAAILGVARAMGLNLESMGISVIPCMGKNNLDRPTAIFRKLEIPVYAIWDSDCGKPKAKPEVNHRLLRLFDQPTEDYPEFITEQFACFKQNLNKTLRNEIGDTLFTFTLESLCRDLCLDTPSNAIKNPYVIQKIIVEAQYQGTSSETLENIITHIINLKDV